MANAGHRIVRDHIERIERLIRVGASADTLDQTARTEDLAMRSDEFRLFVREATYAPVRPAYERTIAHAAPHDGCEFGLICDFLDPAASQMLREDVEVRCGHLAAEHVREILEDLALIFVDEDRRQRGLARDLVEAPDLRMPVGLDAGRRDRILQRASLDEPLAILRAAHKAGRHRLDEVDSILVIAVKGGAHRVRIAHRAILRGW